MITYRDLAKLKLSFKYFWVYDAIECNITFLYNLCIDVRNCLDLFWGILSISILIIIKI